MKIVIPVLSLEIGGTRFIYQLANELVATGHNVKIVLPEYGQVAWPLRARITRVKELTPASLPSADFYLPNFYPTVYPAWASKKARVVRLSLGYEPLWVKETEVARDTYMIDAPIFFCHAAFRSNGLWHGGG